MCYIFSKPQWGGIRYIRLLERRYLPAPTGRNILAQAGSLCEAWVIRGKNMAARRGEIELHEEPTLTTIQLPFRRSSNRLQIFCTFGYNRISVPVCLKRLTSMKGRQLYVVIIATILAGPVMTWMAEASDNFEFLFYLFPVTIDAIDIRPSLEHLKGDGAVAFAVGLYNIKIIVFTIIALGRLLWCVDARGIVRRLYVMTLLVVSASLLSALSFKWIIKNRTYIKPPHGSWRVAV